MSFLLDPIESGINSLLDPLTSTAAATSADEAVPVETSTTDSNPEITSTSRATSTSTNASLTSTVTETTSSSSAGAKTTSSSSDPSDESTRTRSTRTTTTSDDSTALNSSTMSATTLFTLTTTSSSLSSSTSSDPPPAPSAPSQPTLSPAQSASTDNSNANPTSSSGLSTAGIVVAAIIAAALLISIIWLIVRFCPPVRKRIDAWYERRREERTWRAALDGSNVEKGSLSSAGASATDPTRPFSFFALGKNPQLHNGTRDTMHRPQSYVSPNSATAHTPTSAHATQGHGLGLGLGRVSLLRNTSLLRKAGFDAPLPPPRPLQLPLSQMAQTRTSQSQSTRCLQSTMSQIKRKPLPVNPPTSGINDGTINSLQRRSQAPTFNTPPLERALMPQGMGYGYAGTGTNTNRSRGGSRGGSRDGSLPKLQIQIPGRVPGLAVVDRDGEQERVSQIGLAVSGKPAVIAAGRNGR